MSIRTERRNETTPAVGPGVDHDDRACDGVGHDGHCSGRIRREDGRLVYALVCDDCGVEIRSLRSEPYEVHPRAPAEPPGEAKAA